MKLKTMLFFSILTTVFIVNCITLLGAPLDDLSLLCPIKPGSRWNYNELYQNKIIVKMSVHAGMPINENYRLNYYYSDGPDGTPNFFRLSQFYNITDQGIFLIKEMGYNGDITNYSPPQPVLIADINPGNSWDWQSEDQRVKQTSKILPAEQVTIQGKSYEAIVVLTDGVRDKKEKFANKLWLVKNIGVVKQIVTQKGKSYTFELTDFSLKN